MYDVHLGFGYTELSADVAGCFTAVVGAVWGWLVGARVFVRVGVRLGPE